MDHAADQPLWLGVGRTGIFREVTQLFQDVFEQEAGADVMGQAMSGEQEYECVVTNLRQEAAERGINSPVDLSHGISRDADHVRVMVGVSRVVKMPALMASAVSFGKHLGEEVPVGMFQVVF